MNKLERLREYLCELGSVAVAFSSGVDSTFLLKVAHDALGDKAVAVTASSDVVPRRELQEAKDFCASEGIRHIVLKVNELDVEGFRENPKNRCYLCKKSIFTKIIDVANENGLAYVVEGSNMDDNGDYRPGLQAIAELDIKSPLRYAELWKSEIRELSKELNLPTWDKPSFACLASRFAYGETISESKLAMVDKAEQLLFDRGFKQFRVRIHGKIARIEILPEQFEKLLKLRGEIVTALKDYGFSYVTMDLSGYKTGSMNIGVSG